MSCDVAMLQSSDSQIGDRKLGGIYNRFILLRTSVFNGQHRNTATIITAQD